MIRQFCRAVVHELDALDQQRLDDAQARMDARDRERRWRRYRDDLRQRACALLLTAPLTHRAIVEAQRLARAAERVESWRRDASWRAGWGGA